MLLSDVLSHIEYINVVGKQNDFKIEGISFDSREVVDNSCFIAINGTIADGHKFINKAIGSGAKIIVCEKLPENLISNDEITYIIVENSRLALSNIAHLYYNYPSKKLKIIGITGTNGKTSISFILKTIFAKAGYKTGIIGTTGIFIDNIKQEASHTTPNPIELAQLLKKMLDDGIVYVFLEVSSHSLVQHRVSGIDFSSAIFTNLTHDHLDYHKTVEEYAKAKKILFDNLNKNSFAVINGDDEYSNYMVSDSKALYYNVGRKDSNDYIIANEHYTPFKTEFLINEDEISAIIPGQFSIDNISFAYITALKFNIDIKTIKDAIATTLGAPGRMESIKINTGAVAYIDYAHTPDALEKVLLTCQELIKKQGYGKLLCVFGCGGDRDKAKRPIMGKFAYTIADRIFITNDNPRTEQPRKIIDDILESIMAELDNDVENDFNLIVVMDRKKAIEMAIDNSKEGDIILIAGKGHENYQIFGTKKYHFSDKEEVQKFI